MLNFYYRCTKCVFDLCHCILFRFLPLTKLLYVCQKKKYFYFFNTCVQFKVELFLLLLKYVFGQILVLLSIFTFTWVKYLSTFSLKLISYLLQAVFALRIIILLVFCHLIAVVYFTQLQYQNLVTKWYILVIKHFHLDCIIHIDPFKNINTQQHLSHLTKL